MILDNVYFITGTAYAGKSTMVKLLAQKFDGIACEENYDRLLNSGFNVILRDEKLGVQGTLELVSNLIVPQTP